MPVAETRSKKGVDPARNSPYHAKMPDTRKKPAVNKKPAQTKKPAAKSPSKSAKGKQGNNKSGNKPQPAKKPWGMIFWSIFFLVVAGLFFYNRDAIRRTMEQSQNGSVVIEPAAQELLTSERSGDIQTGTDALTANNQIETGQLASEQSVVGQSLAEQTAGNLSEASGISIPDTAVQGSSQTTGPATPPARTTETAQPTQRDRPMYFINVDRDGSILRTKVNRSLPVTDSPLTDTLNALLAGPAPDERQKGLISLIPDGTRVMNATVRGTTAYINFNEDFQFNTYGVEGYAGALRQVVWTATEFPNVRDVQILIEGRRIDYLGEGIWIGSPINRDML